MIKAIKPVSVPGLQLSADRVSVRFAIQSFNPLCRC
jgi:hypothetical protein